MKRRPVVLVDGKNLLYRAHFAHRELKTSKGTPTSVLFGFPEMLLDLSKYASTGDLVICWEGTINPDPKVVPITSVATKKSHTTWRRDLAPFYKANRHPNPEMETATDQIPELLRFLRILGHLQIFVPRLEADDLMGVVGRTLADQDDVSSVILYSGDRDLYQVVGRGNIVLLYPSKKSGPTLMDADDIKKETGVPPEDWPKYKALAGDPSDNMKAIPGCGPKTALNYLQAGVDPRMLKFKALPKEVRKRFPHLEQHWPLVHLCYRLSYIPRRASYTHFPDGSQEALEEVIARTINTRQRKYSRQVLDKRVKRFIEFCSEYELQQFISERRRFFPDTLIAE